MKTIYEERADDFRILAGEEPDFAAGINSLHNACTFRENCRKAEAEIARLRELLQQIVRHHDEAMRAAVGDEANYHQMRGNQVLFHLPPNAQDKAAAGQGYSAEDAFNAGMTRAVDIARAIAESESEEGNDSYGVGWQIADRILKARNGE